MYIIKIYRDVDNYPDRFFTRKDGENGVTGDKAEAKKFEYLAAAELVAKDISPALGRMGESVSIAKAE